ncbi:MAG: RDD family protein [Actinobacteria bacterium]|nr:RDD family protein [Actinomycetota bacterium]MBO0834067.1 RDD family protein [Actinomycetota bacterium]
MAEIVTGEGVPLDLPAAGYPTRIVAKLIDLAAQLGVGLLVLIPVVAAVSHNSSYAAAIYVAGYVVVLVGYPTAFETLSRGKTLGKLALGIRVVGDDGSPVRFRQALVRALAGVIEIVLLAPVGLISSLINARGKRIGDIFAGTYVITERVPAASVLQPVYAVVPPPLAEWGRSLQVDRLSDQAVEAAASYLRRFAELNAESRESLGARLASTVAAQVSPPPPPGTPPVAYLSAVLAVRRQRELAMVVAAQPPLSWAAPPTGPALFRSEALAAQQSAPSQRPQRSPAPQARPTPTGFVPPA